jgi:hypothetical protein
MKTLVSLLIGLGAFAAVVIVRLAPPMASSTSRITPTFAQTGHHVLLARASQRTPHRRVDLVRDIEAALVSVDDRVRERALTESLPQLMARNPSAAARILDGTPPGPNRDAARDRIAQLWAATDLEGALHWVTTLADDDDRRLATIEIRSQIAASDPATALEISDLMDVGRDDGSLAHIAQLWAEENPSAAATWAEKQPAGPLRDAVQARIALVQAAHDAGL